MFSIRKTSIFIAATAACLCFEGCTKKANSQPNVSSEPQLSDPAMERRDWPQSVAYIPNGSAVAGSTGFAYEPTRGKKSYTYYYADTGVFFVNLVTLPYTFWRDGIAQPQTFPGERTNPTHTAVPLLPAGNTTVSPDPTPAQPLDHPANDAPGTVEQPAAPAQEPTPGETPKPTEPPANNSGMNQGAAPEKTN